MAASISRSVAHIRCVYWKKITKSITTHHSTQDVWICFSDEVLWTTELEYISSSMPLYATITPSRGQVEGFNIDHPLLRHKRYHPPHPVYCVLPVIQKHPWKVTWSCISNHHFDAHTWCLGQGLKHSCVLEISWKIFDWKMFQKIMR